MSDLGEAARKLDLAVQRLEAASKRPAEGKSASAPDGAALADTTAAVAARLEEAILRIDRLLEE